MRHHRPSVSKASRRRRRSKRRRNKRQSQQALVRVDGGVRIDLRVRQLELARGYDGFLRGMPEPTMLVGLYRIDGSHARSLGRYLYRFERPGEFPTKVAPRESSQESLTMVPSSDTRVVLLALAVEEDSSHGLQHLYAELEHGDAVVAWTEHEAAPVPMHLPELSAGPLAPDLGHRIHLMFGERDPSRQLRGDDWIDANLLWTRLTSKRCVHRLHFVSADGRNDWTAEVELALRAG